MVRRNFFDELFNECLFLSGQVKPPGSRDYMPNPRGCRNQNLELDELLARPGIPSFCLRT